MSWRTGNNTSSAPFSASCLDSVQSNLHFVSFHHNKNLVSFQIAAWQHDSYEALFSASTSLVATFELKNLPLTSRIKPLLTQCIGVTLAQTSSSVRDILCGCANVVYWVFLLFLAWLYSSSAGSQRLLIPEFAPMKAPPHHVTPCGVTCQWTTARNTEMNPFFVQSENTAHVHTYASHDPLKALKSLPLPFFCVKLG